VIGKLKQLLSPRCPSVTQQDMVVRWLQSANEDDLKAAVRNKEFRYIVNDVFQYWRLRTQIRLIRESRGWTQEELAQRAGMKQPQISALENIYVPTDVTVETLRRLARAMDVRLSIGFASWGSIIKEIQDVFRSWNMDGLTSSSLLPPPFADDGDFKTE
jgi:HTH-type transcriptional regulator / antitoxin HipB